MKKMFYAATALILSGMFHACSCGDNKQQALLVGESDSLFALNDSTEADLQTFVYEGIIPQDGKDVDYLLTIQSVALDSNGNYNLKTTYQNKSGEQEQWVDSGQKITLIGIPNDSTAVVYQLQSNKGGPNLNFVVEGDSALTIVDQEFQYIASKLNQKLHRKSK